MLKINGAFFNMPYPEFCETGGDYLLVFFKTDAVLNEKNRVLGGATMLFAPNQVARLKPLQSKLILHFARFSAKNVDLPAETAIYSGSAEELFRQVFLLYGSPAAENVLEALILNLQGENSSVYSGIMQSLRADIALNPAKDWSIKDMALSVGLSVGHMQELYKKLFGLSPMQDVFLQRTGRAKEYLSGTKLPIAEICTLCGYQNVEHFSRQFKQITGQTPSGYRKSKNIAKST